jgi:hypothetical protein
MITSCLVWDLSNYACMGKLLLINVSFFGLVHLLNDKIIRAASCMPREVRLIKLQTSIMQ